jgi:hypothetical protein
MIRTAPLSLLVLLSTALPVLVRADAKFDGAAAGAQRVDDLRILLTGYVGSCTDPIERRACETKVAEARKAASGRTFVARIPESASLFRTQPKGDRMLLLFTPFIDGGGYALTRGEPRRQDAAGNPLIDLVPIEVRLPPGMLEMDFLSPFRSGAIDIEVVFRPERAWKLKRRDEPGAFEGMAARFIALRVLNARDGSEIASKSW